jgi:hypothetical protein
MPADPDLPEPPWLPVLTATLTTVWQRRGDAWAQVAAGVLALLVPWVADAVTGSPGNLRLTLIQACLIALAGAAAYLLGQLPGGLRARNGLVGAAGVVSLLVTAGDRPGMGQLAALAPILMGVLVTIAAPHPDRSPLGEDLRTHGLMSVSAEPGTVYGQASVVDTGPASW